MNERSHSRRDFLTTASAIAAAAMLPGAARAQDSKGTRFMIGCHLRPFSRFRLSHDEVLDAIKAAGFKSADMIRATPPAPPAAPGAAAAGGQRGRGAVAPVTPESIAALKEKLAARGLTTTIASLTVPTEVPLSEATAAVRKQIADAHALGQKYALYLGMGREDQYTHVTKVLSDAAAHGKERGVQIAIKHHHGLNNTSGELVGWVRQVNHPNFSIFLDPGNVIYYTGRDPVAALEIIGPYVTGVVAKDCAGPHFMEREVGAPAVGTPNPDPRGDEVMIQFGTGKVNFPGIFKKLQAAGFSGPIMVEGTAVGETVQDTVANARANREYLEKVIAGTKS
jgi:sugar phosphate isomerase/epimerase